MARLISPDERFEGPLVQLRLVTMADCTERYVDWLRDPEVNRYLETRWSPQSLETVQAFVADLLQSEASYLLAITERRADGDARHVGNIKIGPVDPNHACADVSYFVGERAAWGRGLATDAVRVATHVAFERLSLHRLQAGAYARNVATTRVLEKCGYKLEGRLRARLRLDNAWDDHLLFGLHRDEWTA